MKRQVIAVAALGALLSWVVYASGRASTGAAPAMAAASDGPSVSASEIEELSRRVETLQAEVQAARRQPADQARATVDGPAERATSTRAEPSLDVATMTREEIIAYEREHSAKVAASAEEELDSEATDPTWSRATEAQIAASVEELALAGARVQSTECKQSLCRMIVDHEGPEIARAFGPAVLQRAPFNTMGTFFHYQEGRIVVYALRPGYAGPAL